MQLVKYEGGNILNIQANGKKISTSLDSLSIADYCMQNEINIERIAIEYNGEILKKEFYQRTILKENDVLEIITFVAGG